MATSFFCLNYRRWAIFEKIEENSAKTVCFLSVFDAEISDKNWIDPRNNRSAPCHCWRISRCTLTRFALSFLAAILNVSSALFVSFGCSPREFRYFSLFFSVVCTFPSLSHRKFAQSAWKSIPKSVFTKISKFLQDFSRFSVFSHKSSKSSEVLSLFLNQRQFALISHSFPFFCVGFLKIFNIFAFSCQKSPKFYGKLAEAYKFWTLLNIKLLVSNSFRFEYFHRNTA